MSFKNLEPFGLICGNGKKMESNKKEKGNETVTYLNYLVQPKNRIILFMILIVVV